VGVIDELALVGVVFAAVALISCLSVSDKRTIRRLPRFLWVILIVLVPIAGPVAWFAFGRPRTLRQSRPRRPLAAGQPDRSPAPDDDPEFLQSLKRPPPRPEDQPDRSG
jgi:hypothetical protein